MEVDKLLLVYEFIECSLDDLFGTGKTGQRSIAALRLRADENVTVFTRKDGNLQLFDKHLSLVRLQASEECYSKLRKVSRKKVSRALAALDKRNYNATIAKQLGESSLAQVVEKLVAELTHVFEPIS